MTGFGETVAIALALAFPLFTFWFAAGHGGRSVKAARPFIEAVLKSDWPPHATRQLRGFVRPDSDETFRVLDEPGKETFKILDDGTLNAPGLKCFTCGRPMTQGDHAGH